MRRPLVNLQKGIKLRSLGAGERHQTSIRSIPSQTVVMARQKIRQYTCKLLLWSNVFSKPFPRLDVTGVAVADITVTRPGRVSCPTMLCQKIVNSQHPLQIKLVRSVVAPGEPNPSNPGPMASQSIITRISAGSEGSCFGQFSILNTHCKSSWFDLLSP